MLQANKIEVENDIRTLLSKIIEVEPAKIGLETHLIEDLGADSMMALEIMAAIEKKYKIEIPEEDLPKMANLQQIINLVSDQLNKG